MKRLLILSTFCLTASIYSEVSQEIAAKQPAQAPQQESLATEPNNSAQDSDDGDDQDDTQDEDEDVIIMEEDESTS